MDHELIEMLKNFIEKNSRKIDLQFDPSHESKLPIDPYSKSYQEKKRTAHYLLLVASIDEGNVVGKADNARKLIVNLYKHFDEKLFEITDESLLDKVLDNISLPLSRLKRKIPEILVSVNRFVDKKANGDLIKYSKEFHTPSDFVSQLGKNIVRMGKNKSSTRKKAWMYMRWMVRDYPDLRIFDHFSPKELFIPLDKNVARVAICCGEICCKKALNWRDVVKVTKFARRLYPNDPAKIDYPFFLLGKKLLEKNKGKPLNKQTLKNLLRELL